MKETPYDKIAKIPFLISCTETEEFLALFLKAEDFKDEAYFQKYLLDLTGETFNIEIDEVLGDELCVLIN